MNRQLTPLNQRQRLWLAVITTAAVALRFEQFGELSLSHFDEGVYVTSALSVATTGWYSFLFAQPLQSPPLFPWMIAGLFWITEAGWPNFGLVVTTVLGAASVPLLFLVARQWAGNTLALVAATLLACSDFHVAYSRMALTDAPLTFWFLLAAYAANRLKDQIERDVLANQLSTLRGIGWTMATALAGGAAWNTKYNGWLVLAIALLTSVLLWVDRTLRDRRHSDAAAEAKTYRRLTLHLVSATLIAGLTYLPWYLYVEHNFPGGYQAIRDNHRSYFSGIDVWPAHTLRLIQSMTALRHWGWLLSITFAVGLFAYTQFGRRKKQSGSALRVIYLMISAVLIAIVTLQGGDVAILLLAAIGLVTSLYPLRWERLFPAIWSGTFLVLVPLYHPYPRLLLPGMPAFIMVALLLVWDAWQRLEASTLTRTSNGSPQASSVSRIRLATLALTTAAIIGTALVLVSHPYGWLPSSGVWQRWSARQAYRAAEQALLQHTEEDAVIICQAQPVLVAYCPRTKFIVEDRSFTTVLPKIPDERATYLLVDFFWLHNQPGKSEALAAIHDQANELTPVAIIPNDLNIVTLMDYLRPRQVLDKVAGPLPRYAIDGPDSEPFPLPPALSALFEDVLVLYRIEPATRPLAQQRE